MIEVTREMMEDHPYDVTGLVLRLCENTGDLKMDGGSWPQSEVLTLTGKVTIRGRLNDCQRLQVLLDTPNPMPRQGSTVVMTPEQAVMLAHALLAAAQGLGR